MVRGSNPGGVEIFAPVQNRPGAHPASYTMGTVSASCKKKKRPVRDVNYTSQYRSEVKERVELYL